MSTTNPSAIHNSHKQSRLLNREEIVNAPTDKIIGRIKNNLAILEEIVKMVF